MVKRALFLLGMVGCGLDEADVAITEQYAISRCDKDFCGGNSPVISIYRSFSFRTDRQPNAEGLRIVGFSKDNVFYDLAVRNSAIVGLDAGGTPKLQGYELQGAKIWVTGPNNDQFAISIEGWGRMQDVVSTNEVDTYILHWDTADQNLIPDTVPAGGYPPEGMPALRGAPQAVCPVPPTNVGHGRDWDESISMDPYQSLVFEGDVIDPATRTVLPTPDDNQFNIACAAHTLAKLRLTRNTIHTAGSWRRPQAALKMLSADYCGTGEAFTQAGEPIVWMDRGGMTQFWAPPKDLEARWDETGATCLNTPRLVKRGSIKCTKTVFGSRKTPLEYCQDQSLNLVGDDLVISGNY